MRKHQIYILLFAILFIGCKHETGWVFDHEIILGDVDPIGLVVRNDSLWVSDVKNNRIVVLDFQGKFFREYPGFQRPMHINLYGPKIFVPEFATDKLWTINGVETDTISLMEKPDGAAGVSVKGGKIAIADFYNHRIILTEGKRTTIIGKEGHNDGELYYPTDVEIYANKVYVADAYNNRVQVFDFNGKALGFIGEMDNINVATGIAIINNKIFVADFEGNRVLVYDLKGELLQTLNSFLDKPTDVFVFGERLFVANYGSGSVSVFIKQGL